MSRARRPNGIELEYVTAGSPSDPPLLLVMGFTAQLIAWPEELVEQLVAAGFFVIRHDNRDCGLSSKIDGVEVDLMAVLTALQTGDPTPLQGKVPYTISDFSDDAFAVLDDLKIERAHIAGASMGGMIVQAMAIAHPERVRSMTSIMSTTGEIEYGESTPEAQAALLAPPVLDRAGYIEASTKAAIWSSKRYFDPEAAKARAAASFDRSFYPEGIPRQLAAVMASPNRAEALRSITVATLVIHGADDQLITPSGGQRTADLVPDAKFLLIDDMGHDLPIVLLPTIVEAIAANAARG